MSAASRKWLVPAALCCLAVCSLHSAAVGQVRSATQTSVGVVTEITGDFVRIQVGSDSPHRYWFKWIDKPGVKPDAALLAAVAAIKVGDKVEVQWSDDGRKRIESIRRPGAQATSGPATRTAPTSKPTTRPSPPPTGPAAPQAVATAPASRESPHAQPTSGATTDETESPASPGVAQPEQPLSEVVNALIDDVQATAQRLLELPVFVLLIPFALVGAGAIMLVRRRCRKSGRAGVQRAISIVIISLLVLAIVFIIDRKIVSLNDELTQLRTRNATEALKSLKNSSPARATRPATTPASAPTTGPSTAGAPATAPAPEVATGPRTALLFDVQEVQQNLDKSFGQAAMLSVVQDDATDIVQLKIKSPLAQAYVAIVDLRCPGLDIRLGTNLKTKGLTSEFARENNCTVAINGEAGQSPAPNSGLGSWVGNMIDHGNVIMLQDTNARPFMSFDKGNRAKYSPAAVVDKEVTPDKYNVIWGRMDALLDGEPVTPNYRDRQPRTAMGIDKDGTRLFLLVVDGRQPNYSMGFTRAEVGGVLKAFGACNGMLCDEGGSSCMYLKKLGGICNIPCDNRGQERPTYTHFGISLREGE